MRQESGKPDPKEKRDKGWAFLMVVVGIVALFLYEYIFLSGPVPADGPEVIPLRVGSYFTLCGTGIVLGSTLLLAYAMKRRVSIMALLVGLCVGAVCGAMATEMYEGSRMSAIVRDHEALPAAVKAYQNDHGELPGHVSALIPKYIEALPEIPDHCAHMKLEFHGQEWALILDCNVVREPTAPHQIMYGHRDTVHRAIYKGRTRQWSQGSLGHHGCGEWPADLRITPDRALMDDVNF